MMSIQDLRHKKGVKIFDNSMLNSYKSCPRKFYYRHVLGLAPVDESQPSYALQYGLAIHKALECWYGQENYKDNQTALQVFINAFTPHQEPPSVGKTGKEIAPTYTTLAGCLSLEAYFKQNFQDSRQVIATELPLAEEIKVHPISSQQVWTGNEYYIAGRIDKVLQERPNHIVYVDYKTTKYPNNFQTLPNGQFMAYKHMLSVWSDPTTKVTGEVDIIGVGKTKSPLELLRKIPVEYTSYQMQQWRQSVVQTMSLIESSWSHNEWPMWDGSCFVYFRDCMYRPMCTASMESVRDTIQERFYKVDFWDPLKVDTTE